MENSSILLFVIIQIVLVFLLFEIVKVRQILKIEKHKEHKLMEILLVDDNEKPYMLKELLGYVKDNSEPYRINASVTKAIKLSKLGKFTCDKFRLIILDTKDNTKLSFWCANGILNVHIESKDTPLTIIEQIIIYNIYKNTFAQIEPLLKIK